MQIHTFIILRVPQCSIRLSLARTRRVYYIARANLTAAAAAAAACTTVSLARTRAV